MKEQILTKRIIGKKEIDRIHKKVNLLGKGSGVNTINFINQRIITSIIVFILSLYIFKIGILLAPIITFIYYYLYEKILLDDKIIKRRKKLESESIHFFKVLTLSLETGRNLDEAIEITINNVKGLLPDEFKLAIKEVKYGKSLTESLEYMQKYIPSDAINNIILSFTQSNIYGSSIITSLNNQIDYLEEKKKLEVKAEISKLPIKISIISVLFFVPFVLLIFLSPALLSYFETVSSIG